MQHFAETVCGKPEVRCVTYKELADYMDTLDAETLAAYKKGAFEKMAPVKLALSLRDPMDLAFTIDDSSNDLGVQARLGGKDARSVLSEGAKLRWEIDGRTVARGARVDLGAAAPTAGAYTLSAVADLGGVEILRSSRKLQVTEEPEAQLYDLSPEDLEKRGLIGDLPEAHEE
jgi:hypothetical protein